MIICNSNFFLFIKLSQSFHIQTQLYLIQYFILFQNNFISYLVILFYMSILSNSNTSLITYSLFIIIILNFILNYLYRHQLYNYGLQLIASFQRSHNFLLIIFFTIPTILIDPGLVIAVGFALIILIKNKYNSFNTVIWILLNAFLSCLLKAFYADPRPFWSRQDIDSIGIYCPQQYGNPSGHSWFSVLVGFGFLLPQFGPGHNSINLYLSILLMIFVPMSRMYLGAHSLNQVIQGLFLGFVMVMFYQFCRLKQLIESFLNNFHSIPGHKWKKFIILMHILYLVGFLMNVKQINPYFEQIPAQWGNNINSECNKYTPPHHLNFAMLMLNSLIINFASGIGWGFEEVINSVKGKVYLSGKWLINQQRYSLFTGYLMFFIIQVGLLVIGFIPAGIAIYLFGVNYIILFIFGNIGALLAGYLYTSKTFRFLFERQVIRQQIN